MQATAPIAAYTAARNIMTPTVQAAVSPSSASAQSSMLSQTQTLVAMGATGRAENSRDTRSGTDTGRSSDTWANTVQTRTDGKTATRGNNVNLVV